MDGGRLVSFLEPVTPTVSCLPTPDFSHEHTALPTHLGHSLAIRVRALGRTAARTASLAAVCKFLPESMLGVLFLVFKRPLGNTVHLSIDSD